MKVFFSRLYDVFCIIVIVFWFLPRRIQWRITNFFVRKKMRHVCGNCCFYHDGCCWSSGKPETKLFDTIENCDVYHNWN